MKLSVVTTLYKSASYIEEFNSRVSAISRKLFGSDFEIIYVNDGSPDNSLEKAIALTKANTNVRVLDLSRNFGHHKAIMTGLDYAMGEYVFLIDSDLEEEPEWLELFWGAFTANRVDVVYGVQDDRRGGLLERVSGSIFYSLFRIFTGVQQPDNIVTARLMRSDYVKALVSHKERELNIGGLFIHTGFSQLHITVNKLSTSPTSYTFTKKMSHLINAITSFSSLPLVFTFYFGLFVSISALAFILNLVYRYYFVAAPPSGYTSMIASVWLFSGLIIFFLGVQGIYLAKIFTEVKARPYTIIKRIYRSDNLGDRNG